MPETTDRRGATPGRPNKAAAHGDGDASEADARRRPSSTGAGPADHAASRALIADDWGRRGVDGPAAAHTHTPAAEPCAHRSADPHADSHGRDPSDLAVRQPQIDDPGMRHPPRCEGARVQLDGTGGVGVAAGSRPGPLFVGCPASARPAGGRGRGVARHVARPHPSGGPGFHLGSDRFVPSEPLRIPRRTPDSRR